MDTLIKSAEFVTSSTSVKMCPKEDKPEFAFIGRSNVGKSSLINMLTGRQGLAKTSTRPGKTQTINHFLVNNKWYLADLPGYGYAKVSKAMREKFERFITGYLRERMNLICLFVLIDARHEPMKIDLGFMENLGYNGIPFARIFTKADKVSSGVVQSNIHKHNSEMLKVWEDLPTSFVTSSKTGAGREDILNFIAESSTNFKQPH